MLNVNVASDLNQFNHLMKQLSDKEVSRALSSALNRSLSVGNTQSKKAIRERFNIPASLLNGNRRHNSTSNTLTAKLGMNSMPISLTNFNPVFKRNRTQIKLKGKAKTKSFRYFRKPLGDTGVTVEVKKGEKKRIPFAFIVNNSTLKPVFARGYYSKDKFVPRHKRIVKSGSDLPITKLLTTSIYGAIQNKGAQDSINSTVSKHLSARVEHELRYRIGKI